MIQALGSAQDQASKDMRDRSVAHIFSEVHPLRTPDCSESLR